MSYILDALKKSEQNRGKETVPNVQTIHSSSLNYHQQNRPLWPWILVAVLIANIFILVYFLKPDAEPEKNSVVVQPVQITPRQKPEPTPEVEIVPTVVASVVEEVIAPPPTQLVDIEDLPAHIRQQIPGLVFSAHVYSTEPAQRSIVINNSFMEEGEIMNRNLTLLEITRTGAIFELEGYRFSTSVLSGWGTP